MTEDFSPLTLDDYSIQARTTDRHSDGGSLSFPLLGLFGEAGSLLSEVKKKQRDRASYLGYAAAVVEELGDVLWYLNAVASRGGLSLSTVAAHLAALDGGANVPALTFASLQPAIMPRGAQPTATFEKTLLRLAGSIGALVADHEANVLEQKDNLSIRLSNVLSLLLEAANEAGVTLEAAAIKNLAKIRDRWPAERIFPRPFDVDCDPNEQLPRDLHIEIFERAVRGQTYVFQRCNGLNIGDRLTDNAMTADDYRFHDVFHYAYVAVLGWSPVTRSLFRLKRKSLPNIDEAQDGARATLIEEGITTWLFGQAVDLDLFAHLKAGELPFDLLKHVRQFVAGYEAEQCPLWLWEEAILQGYSAFRYLREHRRARIHVDMTNRVLGVGALA